MPAVFRWREQMMAARYTTNLSKAQGSLPETLELLELWEPNMSVSELKARVLATGAMGKATEIRVKDIIGRAFAPRFLVAGGKPAEWLHRLVRSNATRAFVRQLILIYTARANLILHDFVREVFWVKYASGAGEVTKQDAREFVESGIARGATRKRWSDSMIERVSRYLLGTLVDFELIEENRYGQRQIRPVYVQPETVVFLAYELHFSGNDDEGVVKSPDWKLFGLSEADVIACLDKAAAQNHLFVQHSGTFIRTEWKYSTMEQMLDALTN